MTRYLSAIALSGVAILCSCSDTSTVTPGKKYTASLQVRTRATQPGGEYTFTPATNATVYSKALNRTVMTNANGMAAIDNIDTRQALELVIAAPGADTIRMCYDTLSAADTTTYLPADAPQSITDEPVLKSFTVDDRNSLGTDITLRIDDTYNHAYVTVIAIRHEDAENWSSVFPVLISDGQVTTVKADTVMNIHLPPKFTTPGLDFGFVMAFGSLPNTQLCPFNLSEWVPGLGPVTSYIHVE